MAVETRSIHHRLEPPKQQQVHKVCFRWREGRCNRYPCPFLHTELSPPSKRSLVWRNPNTSPIPSPSPSSSHGQRGAAHKVLDKKICNYFNAGKCSFGENCRNLHSSFISSDNSFSLLTSLPGHNNVITGIALPSGSDKLYSGSHDESVRVWDCNTGQCVQVINVGSKVGCLISEGPWVFVGIPNAVKAWNTQTATELSLSGPNGQVYALDTGNEMLFAGTHDGRILAWKFIAISNNFEPAASLTGHSLPVVSLIFGAMRLYSGSMDGDIRVWDPTTLQCLHTLTDHKSVVMSLICWDEYLLSCSLDRTIKVWFAAKSGNLEVAYTHTDEDSQGVLVLGGMHDAQAKPVLFCACNDNCLRLYDLPSFSERGKIFSKKEVRAFHKGPGGLFFTGDATGELKVWKWVTNETPVA